VKKAVSSGNLININTAGVSELVKLKGIGPSKAKKIIDNRKEKGPFKSVDDLSRVKGIGVKSIDKFRDQITAE